MKLQLDDAEKMLLKQAVAYYQASYYDLIEDIKNEMMSFNHAGFGEYFKDIDRSLQRYNICIDVIDRSNVILEKLMKEDK